MHSRISKESLIMKIYAIFSQKLEEEKCHTEQLSRKRTRDDDDGDSTVDEGKEHETEFSLLPDTRKRTCVATCTTKSEKTELVTARPTKQMPGHTGYLTFAALYP